MINKPLLKMARVTANCAINMAVEYFCLNIELKIGLIDSLDII
jgi:hypothetical protein